MLLEAIEQDPAAVALYQSEKFSGNRKTARLASKTRTAARVKRAC
jgi:hypothetical protein